MRLRRSLAVFAAVGLLVAGCSSGSKSARGHRSAGTPSDAPAPNAAPPPALAISPASGSTDTTPNRGITVSSTTGGKISGVSVRSGRSLVTGTLNAAGTAWHSTWALDVSHHYTLSVTATAASGRPVTQTSSFTTFTPRKTFTAEIFEGSHGTYGVGMPIMLFFNRPVTDRAAVERSLQVKTSKPILGSWYWDNRCTNASVCLYFRPRHYWPAHTHVSLIGHLDGVQAAPGVYGAANLTQTFTIGSSLIVVASTATHHMDVYRDGKRFARWPISTGKPGDNTPDGTYLTIDKGNPVDMKGPGYNIEVPWSVRFTWSGDFLHDAYWSVGEQGYTNVSHGCVNMPPADAELYYKMEIAGDPVKIVGSPAPGAWDNGWTMWFLSWRKWLKGSALHEAVQAGPHGSTFVSVQSATSTATRTGTSTTTTPG
jgi:lipoprotein-anchoring transpeptidase ErfK/SrfK